jgi:GNAT superfamily N-acetyltransferase
MENIKIRKLTISDMKQIGNLLQTREELNQDGAEKRKRLLEWLAFRNPFANGESTYFVAEDSERIVAHLGRMPTEFTINGRRQRGYFMHDLYVHPEYRKKGKGYFISMALYKAVEENTDSFCCGLWTSPLNLEIQRRRRYLELHADKYVKLLHPNSISQVLRKDTFAKLIYPFLKIVFLVIDAILLRIHSREMLVTEVKRFDSRFDDLNQKIVQKVGIASFKHSSYLNWKYVDRPFRRSTIFAAEEDGQILGFAVVSDGLKNGYRKGSVLEISADPDDARTISSLCREIIVHFKKRKVYSIHCYLTDKRFAKIFKRFLFIKDFSSDPVLLTNLEKCCEVRDYLIDINNWHLSYGDSDGPMLS